MKVLKTHQQLADECAIVFRPSAADPNVGDWIPRVAGDYECDPKTGKLSLVGAPTQAPTMKKPEKPAAPTAKAPPASDAAPKA